MAGTAAEWIAQFRQHVSDCRAASPLPCRESLTCAEECQCQIIGGSLLNWLEHVGPRVLQERVVMCGLLGLDRDPLIVFTSDTPGLVAAHEILAPDHEKVGFLLKDEFSASPPQADDPDYRWHVHVWSFFRPAIEPAFEAQARAKHPIPDGVKYWQHSEGTMWAMNAGRGVDHLWRWNGEQPELLEEALSHWVS